MTTNNFDELNNLFNEMFNTKDIKYTNDHNEMNICLINFIKLIEIDNDRIAQKVFFYFFPPKTAKEKNENYFWFIKYKNNNNYNEYLFALDILRFFIKYMKDKNDKNFILQIDKISKNFKNYKNFNTYYTKIIKYIKDPITIIQAYFSKDFQFYQNLCNMNYIKYDIQSENFINELENAILLSKINEIINENREMKKRIKNLEDDTLNLKKNNENLNDENNEIKKIIKNLNDENNEIKNEIKSLDERIQKIELRDTIKMCFRYLYKILSVKFNLNEENNNFWDQIEIIKNLLETNFNKKYDYLIQFIEDLKFTNFFNLNKEAHKENDNRQLKSIKLLKDYSFANLDDVINFFKKFPYITEFINLNLKFYFNMNEANKRLKTKINYEEVYKKVFESD